jgi:LAO/AO transport system kinase
VSSNATADLESEVLAGSQRALGRAATLIESQSSAGEKLVASLFRRTGNALIIGITGPPGSGKSTLVNQMAKSLRRTSKRVGIIAVDPSSPFTRGAILGDRIRMQDHYSDTGVFIRSMASRGRLGGLAQSTLDMALLLDAAGHEVIIVETVGVGQDEVDIARLADVTVVVLVPGQGDDVQVIKAGIMEIADVFAINKADLPGADRLEQEIRGMQSQGSEEQRAEAAPVRRTVATDGTGIAELLKVITDIAARRVPRKRNAELWEYRLREMLREKIVSSIDERSLRSHAERVSERKQDPYSALEALRRDLLSSAENDENTQESTTA